MGRRINKTELIFIYKDKKERRAYRDIKLPPPFRFTFDQRKFNLEEYIPDTYGNPYIITYLEK